MNKRDIRDYRQWHRDAALRAKRAGFDIVYVYASHDLSLAVHFLQPSKNDRTDEYGGSLENRVRLLREVIADTKDAVGDRCAVAVRLATYTNIQGFDGHRVLLVNELTGVVSEREARAVITVTARLPVDGLYEALETRCREMGGGAPGAGLPSAHESASDASASAAEAGLVSLTRVGDCYAPGTIQAAVYSGHRLARSLDEAPVLASSIRRELPATHHDGSQADILHRG